MAKFYTIGHKKTGVIFVKTEPLRAVLISPDEIAAYAKQAEKSAAEVFGEVGAACKELADSFGNAAAGGAVPEEIAAFGSLLASGTGTAGAEFCFVADVPDSGWEACRLWNVPIGNALLSLVPDEDDAGPRDLVEGELGAGSAAHFSGATNAHLGTYKN